VKKILSLSTLSIAVIITTSISVPQKAFACANTGEQLLGSLCMTAADFCPSGYLKAEGQIMAINTNQALYSLLGTTFGGDGRVTFSMPDLRGRAPAGAGDGPAIESVALGKEWGVEKTTIPISQMHAHTHATPINSDITASADVILNFSASAKIASSTAVNVSDTPTNNAVLGPVKHGVTGVDVYSESGTSVDVTIGPDDAVTGTAKGSVSFNVDQSSINVKETGGEGSISVEAPRFALTFCIATNGIYPSRP